MPNREDEAGADRGSAGVISEETTTAYFDGPGDIDLFRLENVAGRTVTLSVLPDWLRYRPGGGALDVLVPESTPSLIIYRLVTQQRLGTNEITHSLQLYEVGAPVADSELAARYPGTISYYLQVNVTFEGNVTTDQRFSGLTPDGQIVNWTVRTIETNQYFLLVEGSSLFDQYFDQPTGPELLLEIGGAPATDGRYLISFADPAGLRDDVWGADWLQFAEPADDLFTANRDAVDFNALPATVSDRLTVTADIRNALDGADVVRLPHQANYQIQTSNGVITWDPTQPFNGGGAPTPSMGETAETELPVARATTGLSVLLAPTGWRAATVTMLSTLCRWRLADSPATPVRP